MAISIEGVICLRHSLVKKSLITILVFVVSLSPISLFQVDDQRVLAQKLPLTPNPTPGCGPGTDNSACPTATPLPPLTPNPTPGCGPGTDNSACPTATPLPPPTIQGVVGNVTVQIIIAIIAIAVIAVSVSKSRGRHHDIESPLVPDVKEIEH